MTASERRRALFVVGLLPSVLLLLCSLRIALLLQADAAGHASYDDQRYAEAQDSFADNRLLNAVQPWVAPFNEGDALFRAGAYPAAAEAFVVALEDAPEDRECDVRVNLALAREAEGDGELEQGNRLEAETAWGSAREALARCATPTALDVARRLDRKLGPVATKKEPVEPPPPPADLAQREAELAQRNKQALEARVRNDERTTGPPAPVPHW